jgi:hypothetical protein
MRKPKKVTSRHMHSDSESRRRCRPAWKAWVAIHGPESKSIGCPAPNTPAPQKDKVKAREPATETLAKAPMAL